MRLRRPIWFAAAGALLLAPATAVAARLEGELVVAAKELLLVRSAGVEQVFALAPGATLVGIEAPDQLREGDPVRISWSRERNGLKVAESVEATSTVGAGGDFAVPAEGVSTLPSAPGRPLLVDVRSAAAFASGHLPGAISLPTENLGALAGLAPRSGEPRVVFYGEHRGAREPIDALRRALAAGVENPGYLQGGVQEWVRLGRPLVITPDGLAKGLGVEPLTLLDLRERERAEAGTVPGAISAPRASLRWQDFADGRTLPVLILLGEDSADETPFGVAEDLRRWGAMGDYRRLPRVRILEGGWKGWSAGGRKVARGADVPSRLAFALGPGEISREEFQGLLATDPGPRGPLLLEVSRRSAPAWGRSIPVDELAARIGELPRDREIVTYCVLGKRSEIARAILVKHGFRARFLNGTPPPR